MAGPDAPPPARARRFLLSAAPSCAAWMLLGGIHLLISRIVPGTELSDPLLPSWAKMALASTELSLLGFGILLLAGAGGMLAALERKRPGRAVRVASLLLRGTLIASSVFFLGASWAVFGFTGRYVDQRTLQFCFANGPILIQFLTLGQIAASAALLLAGIAVAALTIGGGPRLASRIPERIRISAARIALGLAAVCVLAALGGQLGHGRSAEGVLDLLTRIRYPMSKFYESRRDLQTGPLTHAVCSLLKSGDDPALGVSRSSFEIVRRPQVPLDKVLEGVDRAGLKRRNVVVIVVDSVRADQFRASGSGRIVMPNLEALALEGRSFLDTATQASHTHYATPCPFSSAYPLRSAQTYVYPDAPSYPRVFLWDLLKALGYRTAIVSSQDGRWGNMAAYLRTEGVDEELCPRGSNVDDSVTVDRAIQWVEKGGDRPFMVFMNLQNTHWPYVIPQGWPRRFAKERPFRWPFVAFDPKDKQEVLDRYADALAYTDEQLGRFFEALKRLGVWDQTLVVMTADHGQAFMEHGFAGHASKLYEEVVKVPLIFRGPEVPAGVDRRPAQIIDIAPSILALIGLPPHPAFQGLNLFSPAFPELRSRYSVAQTTHAMQFSVERGSLKLIHDQELGLDVLFDLRSDPGETVDLSATHPAAAADLSWRLSVWRRAQLEYYGSPERCRKEYPPLVVEK